MSDYSEMTLAELFAEAERIGAKYQSDSDKTKKLIAEFKADCESFIAELNLTIAECDD